MKVKLATLAVSAVLLFAGSAAADERAARFTLYEMDCPDCVEFVYDLLTHQDGVQTVVTNVDGNFFTVSFDDEVCSVGVLVDALEMFGYYPVVLDI